MILCHASCGQCQRIWEVELVKTAYRVNLFIALDSNESCINNLLWIYIRIVKNSDSYARRLTSWTKVFTSLVANGSMDVGWKIMITKSTQIEVLFEVEEIIVGSLPGNSARHNIEMNIALPPSQ